MFDIDIPYIYTTQNTRVMLYKEQTNSNLYVNLKNNLTEKVVGKCNDNGFIEKIIKISKYKNPVTITEDRSASSVFEIEFECKLWIPKIKKYIVGKITLSNQSITLIENGPIEVYVPGHHINPNVFNVDSTAIIHKKTGNKITIGGFVIIEIKQTRMNYGDTKIKTIGYLVDIPTEDQIKKYYDDNEKNAESSSNQIS